MNANASVAAVISEPAALTPPDGYALRVVDTLSGESWRVELAKPEVSIGRPSENQADPDVVLISPLVSRSRHALLRWQDGGWRLEHHGLHDTLVQGSALRRGEPQAVGPNQDISIAHFVLSLQPPTAAASPGAEVGQPGQLLRQANQRLMALEQWVHNELLRLMDLRRVDSLASAATVNAREQIRHYLDNLIAEALSGLGDADTDQLLSMAIYRRLALQIMIAGGDYTEDADRLDLDFAYQQRLNDLEARIAQDLDISFDERRMEADAASLDRGFEAVFWQFRLEVTPGLRDYLVSQLIKRDLWDLIFGLGPIQDFMDMDCVSEIMVVARDKIFIEKFGVVEDSRRSFFSDDSVLSVIDRIVGPVGRRVDRSAPLADARLADGSRVNVVIPPLAVKGPCLTIRKFAAIPLEIEDLIVNRSLSKSMTRFLQACILGHKNIIVSGGTGTGKTTLLNCLSRFIPHKERIVSIEDTAELQLKQQHVVTLEARPPNMEGRGAVTIQDLVKNALRMRPDRIVVGECRGPEALDMLQAMNTGHDGSLTTGHANNPHDMMLRLETMVLMGTDMPVAAIREQIVSALDIVVQLTRFPDGSRRVVSIAEVVGIDDATGEIIVEDIFVYRARDGEDNAEDNAIGYYAHTGYIPSFTEALLAQDVIDLETFFS